MINQIIVMFTVTIMLVVIGIFGAWIVTKILWNEKRKEQVFLSKKTYTIKEGNLEIIFEMFASISKSGSEAGRALRNIVYRKISKGNITQRVNKLISDYYKNKGENK